MLVYIIIVFFLLALVFHYDINNNIKGKSFWFKICTIVFILLFGLRYRVGGDSLMYEDQWDDMPFLVDLLDIEVYSTLVNQPLYYIFVATIKSLGGSFVIFQLVHAIIINTIYFSTIKKYSNHIFTAVLLYFIFMSFVSNTEILRESLAVSVFLVSLKYLFSKKWVKYYLCCLIAFNFHISAVISFLIPFVLNFCAKPWSYRILIQVVVIFILFANIYTRFLPFFLGLFINDAVLSGKVMFYTGLLGNANLMGYIGYLINISIMIFFSYMMRKNGLNSSVHNLSINMTIIFTLLNIIIPIVGSRWAGYFSLLYYISLSDLIYSFRRNCISKSLVLGAMSFVLFSHINSQRSPDPWAPYEIPTYVRYIPYHSVFDKERVPEREASTREEYRI